MECLIVDLLELLIGRSIENCVSGKVTRDFIVISTFHAADRIV